MTTRAEKRIRYQARLAERWGVVADSDRDQDLFRRCGELLMAARAFEGAASARRSRKIDPAVLGCFGAALHSLATVSLLLHGSPTPLAAGQTPENTQVARLDRALLVINQNLSFAAGAAEIVHRGAIDEDQRGDGGPSSSRRDRRAEISS